MNDYLTEAALGWAALDKALALPDSEANEAFQNKLVARTELAALLAIASALDRIAGRMQP